MPKQMVMAANQQQTKAAAQQAAAAVAAAAAMVAMAAAVVMMRATTAQPPRRHNNAKPHQATSNHEQPLNAMKKFYLGQVFPKQQEHATSGVLGNGMFGLHPFFESALKNQTFQFHILQKKFCGRKTAKWEQ